MAVDIKVLDWKRRLSRMEMKWPQCVKRNGWSLFPQMGGGGGGRILATPWHPCDVAVEYMQTFVVCFVFDFVILSESVHNAFMWLQDPFSLGLLHLYKRITDRPVKLSVVSVGIWAWHNYMYRQVSNIKRTLVGNKIVDHSDVVGASPVGAAPTTSSFST